MSRRASGALALLAALLAGPTALAKPYTLPPEQPAALPDTPEAQLVGASCSGCHSFDYVTTQPPGKPAAFWRDTVTKMINVYGAPIEKVDADQIAAYLAARYGDGR